MCWQNVSIKHSPSVCRRSWIRISAVGMRRLTQSCRVIEHPGTHLLNNIHTLCSSNSMCNSKTTVSYFIPILMTKFKRNLTQMQSWTLPLRLSSNQERKHSKKQSHTSLMHRRNKRRFTNSPYWAARPLTLSASSPRKTSHSTAMNTQHLWGFTWSKASQTYFTTESTSAWYLLSWLVWQQGAWTINKPLFRFTDGRPLTRQRLVGLPPTHGAIWCGCQRIKLFS